MKNQQQYFTTEFNEDSTSYCLLVLDTLTKKSVYKYDYQIENPLLNLKGDRFGEAYRKKRDSRIESLINSSIYLSQKRTLTKPKSDHIIEDLSLRRSRYVLQDFDIDSIHPFLKNLVEDLDFAYCEKSLNISVDSRTIFIKRNRLESIISNQINWEPYNYAIVQNLVQLNSCNNRLFERRLSLIKSNGQSYLLTEKYKKNERPKFTYGMFGENSNDFDIIDLDSQLLLITYVNKEIKVYDLQSETLLRTIDSGNYIPHKFKAMSLNNNAIIFLPKPIRIGGYDMKKHRGIKGNGIDFSRLKDYDDTMSKIIVYDITKNRIYTKKYRIDEIEKIRDFEGLSIVFNNGEIENIEDLFDIQEN